MAPTKRRNKGKQQTVDPSATVDSSASAATSKDSDEKNNEKSKEPQLVLTSDKRRGIYECDYCHADISQVPRIRCAVCPDFDLCLDCFATTDHTKAISRLKAMGEVHDAVSSDTAVKAVSSAAINHDETHGYRVADSTRYVLFPSTRSVAPSSRPSSVVPIDEDEAEEQNLMLPRTPHKEITNQGHKEMNEKEETLQDNTTKSDVADDAGEDSMDVDSEGLTKDHDPEASTTITENQQTETPEPEQLPKDLSNNAGNAAKAVDDEKVVPESAMDVEKATVVNEDENKGKTEDTSKVLVDNSSSGKSQKGSTATANTNIDTAVNTDIVLVQEDSKSLWTVEEDLRLLDAIETCGLGNWADIAETVAGNNGSTNKPAKRCMERYFDDFLGCYGHILPPYTIVEDQIDSSTANVNSDDSTNDVSNDIEMEDASKSDCGDAIRASKRRRVTERSLLRSHSMGSTGAIGKNLKNIKVAATSSLPGYDEVWPRYLPPIPGIEVGQEVGRDQKLRAENLFVKTLANCAGKVEADKLRKEWIETRLNQANGPTALPLRPEDIREIPGSELAGFMPRRGDFDMEWENDAENIIADMEFSPSDLPADRQLKLQVIEIYNQKLDEREKRKEFLLKRNLLDYRKNQKADAGLPQDERDLIRRMRLIERYHTPEEHKQFITDLLKAKRLCKEIAKLQMYRRMGIRTLVEAERYELDKSRREHHKMAHSLKEATGASGEVSTSDDPATASTSLWKQYKPSNRKDRKSINRQGSESFGSGLDSNFDNVNNSADRDINKDDDKAKTDESKAESSPSDVDGKSRAETSPEQSATLSTKTATADDHAATVSFDIVHSRGYELLSSKEVRLCEKLQLLPAHYLEIKKALIQESLKCGMLDTNSFGNKKKDGNNGMKRTIVKIDAKKKGDVIDFMVRAGWISSKTGRPGC